MKKLFWVGESYYRLDLLYPRKFRDMLITVKIIKNQSHIGFIYGLLSALLFSLNVPVNKWFLNQGVSPLYIASFLYLGVGLGMIITRSMARQQNKNHTFHSKDISAFLFMGALDILAPILFFSGVLLLNASTSSLFANTELFFTLFFAFFIFRERLTILATVASILMVISLFLLGFSNQVLLFSWGWGEILILFSSVLWGLENNISRILSTGNTYTILIVKGLTTGIGVMLIALVLRTPLPPFGLSLLILLAGYTIYGVSLYAYVLSQRYLGASITQTIQSFSFLIGALLALYLFNEPIGGPFLISFALVLLALLLLGYDTYKKKA